METPHSLSFWLIIAVYQGFQMRYIKFLYLKYFLRKLPKTVEICLKKSRPGGSFLAPVYILGNQRYKMYHWLSKGYDEFWLILNYSKVVGDINTKFSPLNVPISIQLCTKFEALSHAQNGFPAKTILSFKRVWRAHFLSHAHQTQEICCFSADVRIILLSFFKLANSLLEEIWEASRFSFRSMNCWF